RLVVLDEPNSSLDPSGDAALIEAIKRLKAAGATVVCIAQRPEVVVQADLLLRVSQGQVDAFGPRDEILSRAIRAAGGTEGQRRSVTSGTTAGLSAVGAA